MRKGRGQRGLFRSLFPNPDLLPVQHLLQLVQRTVQVFVGAALLVDFADGVHHRSVVLISELAANFRQAGFGHLFS